MFSVLKAFHTLLKIWNHPAVLCLTGVSCLCLCVCLCLYLTLPKCPCLRAKSCVHSILILILHECRSLRHTLTRSCTHAITAKPDDSQKTGGLDTAAGRGGGDVPSLEEEDDSDCQVMGEDHPFGKGSHVAGGGAQNGEGGGQAYNPLWFRRILEQENITEQQLCDVECSGKLLVCPTSTYIHSYIHTCTHTHARAASICASIMPVCLSGYLDVHLCACSRSLSPALAFAYSLPHTGTLVIAILPRPSRICTSEKGCVV